MKKSVTIYVGIKLIVFDKAANQKSFDLFCLYFSQVYEKAYGKCKQIVVGVLVHHS